MNLTLKTIKSLVRALLIAIASNYVGLSVKTVGIDIVEYLLDNAIIKLESIDDMTVYTDVIITKTEKDIKVSVAQLHDRKEFRVKRLLPQDEWDVDTVQSKLLQYHLYLEDCIIQLHVSSEGKQ